MSPLPPPNFQTAPVLAARFLRMAPPATLSEKCTAGAAVKKSAPRIGCRAPLVRGVEGLRTWLGAARALLHSCNLKY